MKLEYCSNSAGAVIQEVASSGLLAKWNRSHPKDEIQPGDRILKVNGMKCAGPDMVEAGSENIRQSGDMLFQSLTSGVVMFYYFLGSRSARLVL